MPRGPRLDIAGALHHVMVRGLERRAIFLSDTDRSDFVRRVATVAAATATRVSAWAVLPNHVHLLLRSGPAGLTHFMRRLLTGYAGAFNRRHRRQGHLFQNRFKSILVEEEPYFLELVRYLHLNPIRARVVADLAELDGYAWSGHARLLGTIADRWQDVDSVLAVFGSRVGMARKGYRAFVEAGLEQGRRPELTGGGLRRSQNGWQAQGLLQRGRERWAFDERVLGGGEFVEQVVVDCRSAGGSTAGAPEVVLADLIQQLALPLNVSAAELASGSRRRAVCAARARISRAALREHGLPAPSVAPWLGASPRSVLRAAARGEGK